MPRKQSRGRQRIPIQHIGNQNDMYATFSKRRLGLYSKASALSTLCNVSIGIIVFSPSGNPCSFFSPTPELVIERYQYPYTQVNDFVRFIAAHTQGRTVELNNRLEGILNEKEDEVERGKAMEEKNGALAKGWWEGVPIEEMNLEQVKELKRWATFTSSQINIQKEWLLLNGSS